MTQNMNKKEASPFFEQIHQQVWKRITDTAVEDIVEGVQLLSHRSWLLVVASTGEAGVREELLNKVEAKLIQDGISVVRFSGRRDPFLDEIPQVDCILLEEAPLVPHLEAVMREHPVPWVVTAELREWIRVRTDLQPVELYLIPRKQLPEDGRAAIQLPADEEARAVHLLAGLDIPLPVSLLTRVGMNVSHIVGESKWLALRPADGTEHLVGTEELSESIEEALQTDENAEALLGGLLRIFSAASPEEAGLVVALLRRLALRGARSLAATAVQRGRWALRRLEGVHPLRRRVWAALYSQLGRYAEAREVLEGALEAASENLFLQHARAALLAREGAYERALIILQTLAHRHPDNVYVLHTLGHVLFRKGELEEAERALRHALEIEPGNVYVLNTLGQVKAERGVFDEADHYFQEALEWSPGNAVVVNAWAKAKARQGRFDEAIRKLRQAQKMEPWNPRHYVDLAYQLKERGHLREARQEVRSALEADPQNTYALITLADIETERENWDAAAKALEAALKVEESSPLYTAYGVMKSKRGQTGEAVNHFRKALRLNEKNVHARTAWAELLIREGDPQGAAGVLNAIGAVESLPLEDRVVVLVTWAKVYAAWQQFSEAVERMAEAFHLNSRNVITLNAWAELENRWADWLRSQGRPEEEAEAHRQRAEKKFQQALDIDPQNAYTHDAYARFLEENGRSEEAQSHWRQALELGLDIPRTREAIADPLGNKAQQGRSTL